MTRSRDDMVLRPEVADVGRTQARIRAREERRMSGLRARRGALRRVVKTRAAMRLARRRNMRPGRKRALATAAVGRVGAQTAGRALAAHPVGWAIGAILIGGTVALRLATGQPFEGMGQQLNNMIMGDMDEEARAGMQTRRALSSDPDLARIVGQEGKANAQIYKVFSDLKEFRKRELVGAAKFRTEFPVNNWLDMLIIQVRNLFMRFWRELGGPEARHSAPHPAGWPPGRGTGPRAGPGTGILPRPMRPAWAETPDPEPPAFRVEVIPLIANPLPRINPAAGKRAQQV